METLKIYSLFIYYVKDEISKRNIWGRSTVHEVMKSNQS